MAELKSHNEQSMEEILAAIKHIMAEEGGLPAEPPAAPAGIERPALEPVMAGASAAAAEMSDAPPAPSRAAPASSHEPPAGATSNPGAHAEAAPPSRLPPVQDAILDLTERIDDDESPAKPAAAPSTTPAPSFAAGRLNRPPPLKSGATPGEGARRIVSDATLAASVATLSQVASLAAAGRQQELALGNVGRTLEEMIRDLLRPHLKEWLDAHLPQLVERLVREEIGRLVREAQGHP
jgi:uncharacterized protein